MDRIWILIGDENMKETVNDFTGVDFVPEDTEWIPDEDSRVWEADRETDEEETVVLKTANAPELYAEDMDETVVLKPFSERETEFGGEEQYWEEQYREELDTSCQEPEWEEPEWEGPVRRESKNRRKYGRDPYEREEEIAEIRPMAREITGKRGKRKRKTKTSRGYFLLLRLATVAFLGVICVALLRGFLMQRSALGSFSDAVTGKNYAELLYLTLAVLTVAYGALSMVWTLGRRRVDCDGRLKKVDTGRGMTAFVLFSLLAFLGARCALYLPDHPAFLGGFTQYLLVVVSAQYVIYGCSALGILCCILRRIKKA